MKHDAIDLRFFTNREHWPVLLVKFSSVVTRAAPPPPFSVWVSPPLDMIIQIHQDSPGQLGPIWPPLSLKTGSIPAIGGPKGSIATHCWTPLVRPLSRW